MKRKLIAPLAGIIMLASFGAAQVYADPGPGNEQGQHRRRGGEHGMKNWGAELNLAADQQAKIKAIHEKYRPQQGDKGGKQQAMTELKAILAAPTLDQGRLRALIGQFQNQGGDMQQKMLAAMAEVRNVLTPEQRTKLADSKGGAFFGMGPGGKGRHGGHGGTGGPGGPGMRGHGGPGGMGGGLFGMQRLLDDVTLTAAQNDALNQLKAQIKANREAGQDRGPKFKEAMANFWRTGDQGALKAAMQTRKPTLPVDAMLKFAASLDAQQRAQIASRLGEGHGRKHRRDRQGA